MTDIQTIRMAVAALRSAADDLMKSDPQLALHVNLGKIPQIRTILQQMLAGDLERINDVVRVHHIGLLVKELAYRLEENYR